MAFQQDFAQLGAGTRHLIADVYVRKALDDGEARLASQQFDAAVALAGVAVARVESLVKSQWESLITPTYIVRSEESEWQSLNPPSTFVGPLVESRTDAFVTALALGYDLSRLARFRAMSVGRTAQMAPTAEYTLVLAVTGASGVDGHADPGKFDRRGRGHHLVFLG